MFKNSGQTPAHKANVWGNIEVLPIAEQYKLTVPRLGKGFPSFIGAGGVMSKAIWYGRAISQQEIQDIGAGIRAVFYYGRAEYRDAFIKKRFTNFRLMYLGEFPPIPGAVFNFCSEGNDAS